MRIYQCPSCGFKFDYLEVCPRCGYDSNKEAKLIAKEQLRLEYEELEKAKANQKWIKLGLLLSVIDTLIFVIAELASKFTSPWFLAGIVVGVLLIAIMYLVNRKAKKVVDQHQRKIDELTGRIR